MKEISTAGKAKGEMDSLLLRRETRSRLYTPGIATYSFLIWNDTSFGQNLKDQVPDLTDVGENSREDLGICRTKLWDTQSWLRGTIRGRDILRGYVTLDG